MYYTYIGVQQQRTTFANKAPLIPIIAAAPMKRNQIDLVDMIGFPPCASPDGFSYRYVLSVIDVFSRYLILRPLSRKTSSAVAAQLLQIYCDLGVPELIQCDQGTEFKGAVQTLMNELKTKIITSRPYHPESQGKVLLPFRAMSTFLNILSRLNEVIALGSRKFCMIFAKKVQAYVGRIVFRCTNICTILLHTQV